MCVGSLGEFPSLTDEERRTVIKTVVDEANGRVPVIAGVGSGSTKISVMIRKRSGGYRSRCNRSSAAVLL